MIGAARHDAAAGRRRRRRRVAVVVVVFFIVLLLLAVHDGRQQRRVGQETGQKSDVEGSLFGARNGEALRHSARQIRQAVERRAVLERLVGSVELGVGLFQQARPVLPRV